MEKGKKQTKGLGMLGPGSRVSLLQKGVLSKDMKEVREERSRRRDEPMQRHWGRSVPDTFEKRMPVRLE